VAIAYNDITERKKAEEKLLKSEEELRKLNIELEQRVKERTSELEQKNKELESLNKIFVGRELRMHELKERIATLEKKRAMRTNHKTWPHIFFVHYGCTLTFAA
jgi:nitrate/nitrite-specific signal transduction histidine kinase